MIGAPRDRVDGRPKVTGAARYAFETNLDNVAYAALVSSTIPSGVITNIDTAAAKKVPGVLAVLSHLNAPKLNSPQGQGANFNETRLIPFADGTIHYLGQHIAVIVADTLEQAQHAASLVNVSYDPRPARIVMTDFRADANDHAHSGFSKGDADSAFASAPVKIDETYTTPYEHHNPMEAHSIAAVWDGDKVTLHDSSQNIFAVRTTLSRMFGIPRENVHVMSPFVGGAFGSKGGTWPHVVIGVLAAREVKRPVKLMVTRRQLFFANGHRPATEQRVRLGATEDGKLVSIIHDGITQSNEICDYAERFSRSTRTIYATPNMRLANPVVDLNIPTPTYMRAPGESPGLFAIESAMDELAAALKLDPIQVRLINHADADPSDGKPWSSKSLKECYARAADRFGWPRRKPEPRSMRDGRNLIGWGMASAVYPSHRSPASVRAVMKSDGTVIVSSGSHEMGMGTATVMAQLAAETLGVPFERVRFEYGDTTLPQAPISAGSMTVSSVGSAVFGACNALKQKLAELGGSPSDPSVLAKHYLPSVEVQFDAKPDEQEQTHSSQAFGAQFAEVSVDPDLGIIRVPRIVSAFGGGRILNAKTARSQFLGGIVQGIGMALLEETRLDHNVGTYTSVSLAEYLVPVNADIRSIDIIMVEEDDPYVNPIGAKGIGEIGIVGVAAAIANAVYHATGKRVRDLPITIEKVM